MLFMPRVIALHSLDDLNNIEGNNLRFYVESTRRDQVSSMG